MTLEMKPLIIVIAWGAVIGTGIAGLHTVLVRGLNVPTADALQVDLLAVLVGVTAAYAWSTNKISVATQQQANASVEMAQEAEAQRLALWEPLIQPYVRQLYDDIRTHDWEIHCHNAGKGDAYEIEPIILSDRDGAYCERAWTSGHHPHNEPQTSTGPSWPYIPAEASQIWQLDTFTGGRDYVAAVLYKDRFGRQFISGYAFRVEGDEMRPTKAISPRLFKEALS